MQTVSGSVDKPASNGPYPPTVCSCRTRKNRMAPSAPYTRNVTTFAALKVRLAKMPSGSIGCELVRSTTTNPIAASNAAPAAHGANASPHSISAYVVPPSATAARTAPVVSKRSGACGSSVSGTQRRATRTVTTASGRLSRKIQRQSAYCTSAPPTNGPIAAETLPSPDQAPIAWLRSSGWNEPWIIARLPGISSAAPIPCRTRAAIRISGVGASPHSSEASANQTVPMTNTRRRP